MHGSATRRQTIYVDGTHLRGRVTGIERVTLDLFSAESLAPHDVRPVVSRSLPGMIARQQVGIPLKTWRDPQALFVFPGFPPGPLCAPAAARCLLYIHDTFLLSRPEDLSLRSRVYLSPAFALAMRWGRNLFVNSRTTGEDLRRYCAPEAGVFLLRPPVRDVFTLSRRVGPGIWKPGGPLKLLAIGTVEPRKNYPASLAIVEALNSIGIPAELHLVGRSGWGRHAFLDSPPPYLHMHGYLADSQLQALAETCHALLSTSKAEGLGLPLLEVQHGGLPVIAPDAPVFREVLGRSGLLIHPDATDASARRIGAWVASEEFGAALHAARDNVGRWNGLAATDAGRLLALLDGDPLAYAGADAMIPGRP
ncbi:glycosyltransferase [Methylobacterium sp. J-076]|uniref:glycosyltransferase n=1 Tax=Methylobacterium sp. J-076 TaxID=2836655 RepID=UPI001FBA5A54|nr:glycosyltransferase [Methylobacterium sp. J-076]MCJ2012925.1 glycosyltransferase [Methylobacterium sp. J-076]